MKFLRDFEVRDKKILVRADFNEPLKDGQLLDDFKIKAALPTIEYLFKQEAKIILISHLGRPDGRVVEKLRLDPISRRISQLLNQSVKKLDDCIGGKTEKAVSEMKRGDIILLENIQFYSGEKNKDKKFIQALAKVGDIFVLDAFGQTHRDYASISGLAGLLPSCAGLLLEDEIKNLEAVMHKFETPLIAIVGGAKISDKIGFINNFLEKADKFLAGGAIANTFFASQALPLGDSVYEPKMVSVAAKLSKLLTDKKLILPIDSAVKQRRILDIGPETIKIFQKIIGQAKTIIWNGPMGLFEDKKFANGTFKIAEEILKNKKAKIVIGGGETITAIKANSYKPEANIFISTGGGAMLEYLAGKKLPGIEALG